MEDGLDLAEYSVSFGVSRGASFVEARFVDAFEEVYAGFNGMLLGAVQKPKRGIGIRVLAGGGMGFCSTSRMEKGAVERIVGNAISMARASSRENPIRFSEEKVVEASWETPVKREFSDVPQEDKMQWVYDLDKELKAHEFSKDLKTRTALLDLYSEEKFVVTSEGTKVRSRKSLISFYSFNTAQGHLGSEQRTFGKAGSAGWEWLDEEHLVDSIVADNAALVKTAREAKPVVFDGPVDVIISPEIAGICAHENVGHPSEADRVLGREAAQAGESFYWDLLQGDKDRVGTIKLGSDAVNVIDDPTLPGSAGFYLYDDEGVEARPRYLIKEGYLNELLLNREFAARFETVSNGSARAISFQREPITRMANTYFERGDHSLEELVEGVKRGILMKSFTEWNIDDRRFQSKYVGLESYLIEEGKLTDTMVRRPVLEITTTGLLTAVDAVSDDFEATYAHCGKSDPMQGVPVWTAGPNVRLRGIRLGGGVQ
ncbi:MAG: TldD/PmbA family protein [Promethearchaeota archaeon]